MPLAIAISFPGGRFQAAPGGQHVTEGAAEWPPSPWRVLRALVATWKGTGDPVDAALDEKFPAVLAKLTAPPVFKLPVGAVGPVRTYMPGSGSRRLALSTGVAIRPEAEVGLLWPDAQLSASEEEALARVLGRLTHLGPGETGCSARICFDWKSLAGVECGWADPETGEVCRATREIADPIRTLCASPQTWHRWDYESETSMPNPAWNLLAEAADGPAEAWSKPPGSRWVIYYRPIEALTTPAPDRTMPNVLSEVRPTMVRYLFDGPALPPVTDTLYIAEMARRQVQRVYGERYGPATWPPLPGRAALSGRAALPGPAAARPRLPPHHAFFLPTDENGDGALDHLTVYARGGFNRPELDALDALRRMRGAGGARLNLRLLGWGEASEQAALAAPARRWRSVTPFVMPRDRLEPDLERGAAPPEQLAEAVLRDELARRGWPEPVRVQPLPECVLWNFDGRCNGERRLRWGEFRQRRAFGDGIHGDVPGLGFEIEFPERRAGPLALGYACHYGLGLFVPLPE